MIVASTPFCVSLETSVSVRVNIIEPNNGKPPSTTQDARPRYTGERLLRERPKIYRQVVRLLGEGWSKVNPEKTPISQFVIRLMRELAAIALPRIVAVIVNRRSRA